MTERERVLDAARRELGTCESPAGSNRVKYNTEYYGRAVRGAAYPWCCVFLWWCFQKAGLRRLFYGGGKTASCGELARWARRTGRFVEEDYRPGDVVFLRFSGKTIQHAGLVERVNGDGTLTTLEGNTGAASSANGGEVQRRRRTMAQTMGAFRPEYQEEAMTQEEFDTLMETWLKKREAEAPSSFSAPARAWAERQGIIQGGGAGQLSYKGWCTREQAIVFLHRLMGEP